MNDCAHPKIVAWVDTKTQKPAALWSCAACDQRFVPMSELLAVESKLGALEQLNGANIERCGELQSRLDSVLRAVRGFLAGEIVRADLAWMTRDDSAVENPLHRCPECNGIMDAHLGSCSRAVESQLPNTEISARALEAGGFCPNHCIKMPRHEGPCVFF
jgi:hypothetical protein